MNNRSGEYADYEGMLEDAMVCPPAPMPTDANKWGAQFRNHIAQRLIDAGWSEPAAWSAAEAEYNGLDEPVDLTDDPIASADESMSYWDADE